MAALLLLLLALGTGLIGFEIFQVAKSSIHEIEAILALLASSILFVGAVVTDALGTARRQIVDAILESRDNVDPDAKDKELRDLAKARREKED